MPEWRDEADIVWGGDWGMGNGEGRLSCGRTVPLAVSVTTTKKFAAELQV